MGKGNKIIEKILEKRGIDKERLKKEKREHLEWKEMDRVVDKVATDLFLASEGKRVGVLYDVDVDGLFSGYIMEDYLKRHNIEVLRYMNTKKKHGLTSYILNRIKEDNLDWLFIVDAGSGDIKNIRSLTDTGVNVIVLDHHHYDKKKGLDDEKSWILNIKDKQELPSLSGCGVTFRFIEKLGKMFDDLTGQYEKFVGITVLSDMCDMSEPENRYYVQKAYEGYEGNRFLQQFKFYGSGRSFYSFGVIPYLNACIRVGEEEHAMDMVNNMNNRLKVNIIDRDRNRVITKQEKLKKEIYKNSKLIKRKDIVLLLRKGEQGLRTVGGLVANELVSKYQRPAMVLYREGNIWKGSFRSNSYTNDLLVRYNFKAMGHAKACGLEVNNEDIKFFIKNFKYEGKHGVKKVAFSVSMGKLSKDVWRKIAVFNEYSGVNMESIYVRIKDGVSGAVYVDEVSKKKNDIIFKDVIVTDFTGKSKNDLIVEPILKGTGYQLIRV